MVYLPLKTRQMNSAKYYFLLPALLMAGLFISCQSEGNLEKEHLAIMEIHDEVMPMISDMVKIRKELANTLEESDSTRQVQIKQCIRDLQTAEKEMWDWMAVYQKPTTYDGDTPAYLSDQKQSIQAVSDAMKSSYEQAQKLLNE